jgi:hypothetical protein
MRYQPISGEQEQEQVSVLTIDTRARSPELVEAFVAARSGPRDS